MTKTSNRDSVLRSNFCDIDAYFREQDVDYVDRLAQRALTILRRTDHLVQTGYEADTDPFTANMFASSALGMINENLKTYPFVRDQPDQQANCETTDDEDALFDAAEELVSMAEELLDPTPFLDLPASFMAQRQLLVLTEGFRS